MKHLLLSFSLFTFHFSLLLAQSEFVNPFIGTGGHGHTFPGATTPFGMVQLSPDTRVDGSWDGCSGYHYSDKVLYGFSHTHLSGTGCSDYGDVLLMPFASEKMSVLPKKFTADFSHAPLAEMASPGYYGVRPYNGILCEMTATTRAGFHHYNWEGVDNPDAIGSTGILLDLYHRDDLIDFQILQLGDNEIYGFRRSKAWAKDQTVYFWITFSEPIAKSVRLDKNNEKSEKGAKIALQFGKKLDIKVKVGISGVDAKGANRNLAKEIPHWDFEKTKQAAKAAWDKELSKIKVEGGTKEQNTTFYTALYHCMIAPNVYSDVDGQYRGRDNKIHSTGGDWDYYTVFSLWDTYRALHPLLSIIDEKRTNHFIRTFIRQYEEGGILPVWELSANETNCMIGYHSVSVIADAYMKGIRDYDVEKAFAAMKHSAMQNHLGLDAYKEKGYVPSDKDHESVSKTLEYCYDDWCIAQMAKGLGKLDDYNYFMKRSQGYLNLFDPETGFFRPRKNGGWYSPFRPSEVNNHYTEGNAYHYSFGNQHDIANLSKLLNGNLSQKLDSLFMTKEKLTGREQADVTGLIGQYAHGNEPSHHIPYLYKLSDKPYKTAEIVHQIMTDFYTNNPDGLCGNEDCGQMSAWYVMSAMGFYAASPGSNVYELGTPAFPEIQLQTSQTAPFIIQANNLSEENYYVKSASIDNELVGNLTHSNLLSKKKLTFEMANEKTTTQMGAMARSNNYLFEYAPVIEAKKQSFKDTISVRISRLTPAAVMLPVEKAKYQKNIYFTLDGTEPDTSSFIYSGPILIDKTCTLKAKYIQICTLGGTSFINSESVSSEAHFNKINPDFRVSLMNCKPNSQYYADGEQSLIDGVRGDKNWRLGNWMGFQGQDVEIVIDLGKLQKVNKISLGCLQDFGSWIAMPKEVSFEIAKDGGEFEPVQTVKNIISDKEEQNIIQDFNVFPDKYARRIRIKAKNYGILPEWHPGKGGESFIFVDEVGIE